MSFLVATTSLPAVYRRNNNRWNAACSCQYLAPKDCTEIVLHLKFLYRSQFSGTKNYLKIRYLIAEILSKNPWFLQLGGYMPPLHQNLYGQPCALSWYCFSYL